MSRCAYRFRAVGILFPPDRPPLDDPAGYHDLRGMTWDVEGITEDLRNGNLPPGLIIAPVDLPGGLAGVVVEDPKGGQMVRPLDPMKLSK